MDLTGNFPAVGGVYYPDNVFNRIDLIDNAVASGDAGGIKTGQFTEQFLALKGVFREIQQDPFGDVPEFS